MTRRARNLAAIVGAIGALIAGIGVFVDARRAAWSFLVAYVFVLTLSLGALAFLMMANVTRAKWFVAIRRVLEAMTGGLPLLLVLFLPIAFGMKHLYPWARDPSSWGAQLRETLEKKHAWLSTSFFLGRAVFYLVVWNVLAFVLRRASLKNDVETQKNVSGVGLPLLGLTITFAAFDWMMSTDPTWASNVYGVYVFAGAFFGAIALVSVLVHHARGLGALPKEVGVSHGYAVGNLTLAATIFWAYIAFVQLLIFWMTDLPEEVSFYAARIHSSWLVVTVLLGVAHFVVPFFILLQRDFKRRPPALATLGGGLMVVHYVDVHWLLMPNARPDGFAPHWLDVAALLAVGGLTYAFVVARFLAAPTVPESDPALAEALAFEIT